MGSGREDEPEEEALRAELAQARERLDAALTELAELKASLAGALVHLDPDRRVTAVAAWPWAGAPAVGDPLEAAFDPESTAALARAAERGWLGLAERRYTLADGRSVALTVAATEDGWRVTMHDVTRSSVLDRAQEQRNCMRAVADLAESMARDLIDPMSIVQGRLELLLDLSGGEAAPGAPTSDPARRHLTTALEHSRRVTATLRNLRLVGRTAGPPAKPVPFGEVLAAALELLGPRRSRVNAQIEPETLAIGCDAALPARVCASLVRCALDLADRGVVQLRARRVASVALVQIHATGRAESALDPESLALDRTLLASVGGSVAVGRIGSVPTFELALPLATIPRARPRPPRARILNVGASVARAVPILLDREGYQFVEAGTVDDALAALERGPCDYVISDLLLDDGSSGLALADAVSERFRSTRVIVLSASDLPPLLPVVPLRWPTSREELLTALGGSARRPGAARR